MSSLLSQDFYDSLDKQPSSYTPPAPVVPAQPGPVAPQIEDPTKVVNPPPSPSPTPINQPVIDSTPTTMDYFPRELGSALGLDLPSSDDWVKLNHVQQSGIIAEAIPLAIGQMVRTLPKALTRDVLSLGATALKPIYDFIHTGKPSSTTDLENQPKLKLPWVGEVPTMYQEKADMEKAGVGPLAASLLAGGNTILKMAQTAGLAEAFAGSFAPRGKIAPGETMTNTAPIRQAILNDNGVYEVMKKPEGSVSEYNTMPKTQAKAFGGTSDNTHWKLTPVGDGNVEISVTKLLGKKGNVGDIIETPYGTKTIQAGDFGNEIKLQSEVVPVKQSTGVVSSIQNDKVPFESAPAPVSSEPIFIEPRAKKGFENAPITADQISTLDRVTKANNIDPEIKNAIVRTVTGKSNIGELTQTDYVNAAQTLSKFGTSYNPTSELGPAGWIYSKLSPQRHLFDYVEERFGVPLKSKVYTPIEEGSRLANILSGNLTTEFNGIFGKYTGGANIEERRLIDGYVRGNESLITENPKLTPQVKSDLIDIAGKLREFYNKTGPVLNVPTEVFLKNYLPTVQDIGGVVQRYKDLSKIPGEYEFFAKQKKYGNLGTQIDDPLVTGHIYIRQGSRALHLGQALADSKALIETLPKGFQDIANSYVQEKLGYAGQVEKFVDSFVPSFNKQLGKIGVELPADASRQMASYSLSSFYAGYLSSPATAFRQLFQVPTFIYGRLGPKFMGSAIAKALTKEGTAEVAAKGFLLDQATPYGEELTKDFTPLGRAGNIFKNTTQKITTPTTMTDNLGRKISYFAGKFQWEDAISKYNSGKITWPQFEGTIDLKSFSQPDRNLIRQKLVSGDMEGAFNSYIGGIIDDTSFPYRKAASAKVTYGLAGKISTGLMTYSVEAANVLGKWAKNGEWEKFIRFAAGAKTTNDTLKETFGFDFSKTLSTVTQFGVFSPFSKDLVAAGQWLDAARQNSKQDMDTNSKVIYDSLTSGIPGGVLGKNLLNFKKSYQEGPDQNGEYGIFDSNGKLKYRSDFSDLFWTTMGFPTLKKVGEATQYTNMTNDSYEYTQTQNQINTLMREGNYDEADKIIEKTGIPPSQEALKSRYLPRNIRNFEALPAFLKAKYANMVFPGQ